MGSRSLRSGAAATFDGTCSPGNAHEKRRTTESLRIGTSQAAPSGCMFCAQCEGPPTKVQGAGSVRRSRHLFEKRTTTGDIGPRPTLLRAGAPTAPMALLLPLGGEQVV